MTVRRNPGHCPTDAIGRRVNATLVRGWTINAPADGRGACRWTRTGDPHDIETYEVLA